MKLKTNLKVDVQLVIDVEKILYRIAIILLIVT